LLSSFISLFLFLTLFPHLPSHTATQVFIWLALLLAFGLQFYLAVFCLLKCWSFDTRLKQALKNLLSTGKLLTTGRSIPGMLP
jgi:hypothetical protein